MCLPHFVKSIQPGKKSELGVFFSFIKPNNAMEHTTVTKVALISAFVTKSQITRPELVWAEVRESCYVAGISTKISFALQGVHVVFWYCAT